MYIHVYAILCLALLCAHASYRPCYQEVLSPAFFGSFDRLVAASSRSCRSFIEPYISLAAPRRLCAERSPRFAESAAPAACCCFFERAAIPTCHLELCAEIALAGEIHKSAI